MKTILVASSKGGAGKTTLATNLAAYFALDGKRTVLVDADPQHSSTRWAERRAELESAVLPIDASGRRAWRAWLPEDAERVVVNTLAKVPRVHKRKLPVGLVVNRSKPWTNASQQAVEMLKTWPYPVITQLRDTQAYVVMAGLGRSLFDYRSAQVREHQADWEPLLKWIKKA